MTISLFGQILMNNHVQTVVVGPPIGEEHGFGVQIWLLMTPLTQHRIIKASTGRGIEY